MGFLSSLFGGGDSRPATSTNVISQKLPPEIAPYVKQILTEGSAQFEAEKAAGYQPYTGQTTAGLTAQQEAALTGLEGIAGTQQPFLDEAGQIIRQGADQFTGDVAQQYMSPYQQAVTDIELREAGRRFEGTTMPKLEAQAVNMGAMSGLGSRAGVEMAEAQRSQNQLLADIQAKGQQKAYESARQEYGFQKAREGQMAENVAQLGAREFGAGLGELGALKSAGEERQGLAQSALDEAYLKYQQEQQFPKQNLAEFSQLVYGNPLVNMGTRTNTGTDTPYQPSTGQTLLGMGLGAANIYGMSGGFSKAGPSFNTFSQKAFGTKAEGGQVGEGLTSLPTVNAQIGTPGGMVIPRQVQDIETLTARYATETDPVEKEKIRIKIASTFATPKSKDLKKEIDSNISGTKKIVGDIATRRGQARSTGLLGIKNVLDSANKERQSNLTAAQGSRNTNLIAAMKARGASTKEIQAALANLPKVGPGLSTKTGSAQGIGKDITNILDTLRTDVYKQAQLDRQQERADIKDIGRMKRADQEKGIEGTSAITESGARGKAAVTEGKIAGAKLIDEKQAANIMAGINEEEKNDLLIHAQKVTGKKDIRALSISQLNEYYKKRELELKEIKAETDRITAKNKNKQGEMKPAKFNALTEKASTAIGAIYDKATGAITGPNKQPINPEKALQFADVVVKVIETQPGYLHQIQMHHLRLHCTK